MTNKYSDNELELMETLYVQGASTQTIGQRLGRTARAIENKVSVLGIKRTAEYRSEQALKGLQARGLRMWNNQEDCVLRNMYEGGAQIKIIMQTLDRNYTSIAQRLHKLKIKRKP